MSDEVEKVYWTFKEVRAMHPNKSISTIRMYLMHLGFPTTYGCKFRREQLNALQKLIDLQDIGFTIGGAIKNLPKADRIIAAVR